MLDARVKTFLAVCRKLNYTHAARELNLTQSAVSQHMAFLEQHYGAKLVEFEGRTMRLTKEGELVRRAFQSFSHDEQLLERQVAQATQGARSFAVGVTLTAGDYLVARPLARYLAAHPSVRVSVAARDTAELLGLLARGEIDCAFVEGIFEKSELAWEVLCAQELVCVCAPSSPLAGRTCTFESLLDEPLIVREPESGTRAVLEHALVRRNLTIASFADVSEVSSIAMIKTFVARGLGVSFLYEAAVRDELRAGMLARVDVAGGPVRHDISFVWPQGSLFEDSFRALFEGVREEFARDDGARRRSAGDAAGGSASPRGGSADEGRLRDEAPRIALERGR